MNEPFMNLLYMLSGGMAAVALMILIRERPAQADPPKPEPKILGTPCPWCKGNMEYHRIGGFHAAICRSEECGFASKTATAAAMANDIAAQRGKAPNASFSGSGEADVR